ncbi:hypothetical protein D3C81_897230 [compost metagenome]
MTPSRKSTSCHRGAPARPSRTPASRVCGTGGTVSCPADRCSCSASSALRRCSISAWLAARLACRVACRTDARECAEASAACAGLTPWGRAVQAASAGSTASPSNSSSFRARAWSDQASTSALPAASASRSACCRRSAASSASASRSRWLACCVWSATCLAARWAWRCSICRISSRRLTAALRRAVPASARAPADFCASSSNGHARRGFPDSAKVIPPASAATAHCPRVSVVSVRAASIRRSDVRQRSSSRTSCCPAMSRWRTAPAASRCRSSASFSAWLKRLAS